MLTGYIVWFGSLTITELMWSVVGFVGLLVSLWNLSDCWSDRIHLKQSGENGQLREVAHGAIEQEILVGIIPQIAVLLIGVITAQQFSPPNGYPTTVITQIFISCLFAISVCVAIASIRRRMRRKKIVELGGEDSIAREE